MSQTPLQKMKELFMNDAGEHLRLHDLVGLESRDLDACFVNASRALAAGQLDFAAKLFLTLCALDHGAPRHWRGLGVVMQRQGNKELAASLYTIALEIDEDDVGSRVFRAEILMHEQRFFLARIELERAFDSAKAQGTAVEAYVRRGQTLMQIITARETADDAIAPG